MRHTTILLADASEARRRMVRASAVAAGFTLTESATPTDLLSISRSAQPEIVILGCDDRDGTAILRIAAAARSLGRCRAVVLIVENGSEALAVAALRAGVSDYLRYPLGAEELAASLSRFARASREDAPVARTGRSPLVGSSTAMVRVQRYLQQVADSDSNVLITGETGTGKELAAAYLHEHSSRRHRRLVTVNCAAIPDTLLESELFGHEKGSFTGASTSRPGLLETADGGTVFLDEIGEMGMPAQAKILRAIEAREVYRVGGRGRIPLNVRVVAATNQDLEHAVDAGRFRKDLYYRLQVASIHLPPLRERQGDIAELLDHYLAEFNARGKRRVSLSGDTRRLLETYDWPGNVRELKNMVESLFVCPADAPVRVTDLPDVFRRRLDRFCAAGDDERRALLQALFTARWNKSRAAEILECSRMTLYRRMAKHSVIRSTPLPDVPIRHRKA